MEVLECAYNLEQKLLKQPLFYGHGTENAFDEACAMIAHVLGVRQLKNTSLNSWQLQQIHQLAQKRLDSFKPLPYLLGYTYFCDLKFFVNEQVLIPRSPIAEMINDRFLPYYTQPVKHVLDLCTGSGAIGIAIAKYLKCQVTCSDICTHALDVVQKNVSKHNLEKSVQIIQSDLFENITQKFDLIITNPPYVPKESYQKLPNEYQFEPQKALIADDNGLKIGNQIVNQAPKYLKNGGILVIEMGEVSDRFLNANKHTLWQEPVFENGGSGVLVSDFSAV